MEHFKISAEHLPLLTELLDLSNEKGPFGRGYPQGDLAGLTHEFKEIGQDLMENFYVVGDGLVGFFDAPWGHYVIGPLFLPKHHQAETIAAALKSLSAFPFLKGRKLKLDIREENEAMLAAAKRAGLKNSYRGVAMEYALSKYEPAPDHEGICEVAASDQPLLEQVAQIFTDDLELGDSSEWTVSNLEEMLEDGTKIAVLTVDGQVAGAVIYSWDEELSEGEAEYVCVKKACQGRGYGKALIHYMVGRFADEPEGMLYLDTARTNVKAQNLYLRYGFEITYYRHLYELEIS